MVWNECTTTEYMVSLKQLKYQCADGVGNQLNYYIPAGDNHSELAVLCIPALGIRAEKYNNILHAFASHGVSAGSFDLRGNHRSSIRPSRKVDFGYHEQIEYELPAAIDTLLEATNSKAVILFGHSIGAHISVLGQCHNDPRVKGIVISAAGTVYYRNWSILLSPLFLLMTQVLKLIIFVVGHYPGQYFGFAGKEAKRIMNDFAHTAVSGEFKFSQSDRNFVSELSNVKPLVLAINYANDWYAPIKGTDHLLSFLPNADVERQSFNKYQLNLKTANHFSWMKRPNTIVATVVRWLSKHSLYE